MMKDKIPILILAFILFLANSSYAQQKKLDTDLVIGASIPELYHIGIRFHYIPNARIDFNFGSDFKHDANGILYAVTFNHAYYVGKVDSKVNQKLWSINSGFSFLVEANDLQKSTVGYLNLFLAREFPISKKIFIQPELGASYFLFEDIINTEDVITNGYRVKLIPKFGLNLIVKI